MEPLSIFVTGHELWDECTQPCLKSIFSHISNTVPVLGVDVGSPHPYPKTYGRAKIVRSRSNNLPRAANLALKTLPESNFYLWLANDNLVIGDFGKLIAGLNNKALYSRSVHTEQELGATFTNLSGGFMLIPYVVYKTVGVFDAIFDPLAWEDADYAIRAEKAGFTVRSLELPIMHLGSASKQFIHDYSLIRARNLLKLIEKHGLV